jgi:translation initiation factor IF-2
MADANKPVRLSKAAREFNLGIGTIVDFLDTKGINVDANPNTKLTPDVYAIVRGNFQGDKEDKEAAQRSSVTVAERENITLASARKRPAMKVEAEEQEIDLSIFKKSDAQPDVARSKSVEDELAIAAEKQKAKAASEAALKASEESAAEEVANNAKLAQAEAEAAAKVAAQAAEAAAQAAEAAAAEAEAQAAEAKVVAATKDKEAKVKGAVKTPEIKGLKVLGKLDFEAQAKEASEKKAAAVVARAKANAEKDKIVVKSALPDIVISPDVIEEKPSITLIKTKIEKLSGPKVLGKIVLPVEKKRTKDNGKRKRVRVKVDIEKAKTTGRGVGRPGSAGAGGRVGANKGTGGAARAGASKGPVGRGGPNRGPGNRGVVKKEVSQEDIKKEIRDTLARLSGGKKSKSSKMRRAKRKDIKDRSDDEMVRQQLEETVLKLTEFVTVQELATMMDKSVNDVISACMTLGIMVSINQRLDSATITMIAEDFGFEVEFVSSDLEDSIELEKDSEEDLVSRPPIITVMGHVDHGKTSLLDYVRKANVIAGEAGGITQHIGAYSVVVESGQQITFLDTPGHEAFTAMRARGAQVTDLAIIVIASDDAVMPQTKEAIHHAQAAEIPMIFALNKMDREAANPDKIKKELSEMNVLVEEWGGKYQCQEISAKEGTNIEELLEKVLLEAEMLELKANPAKRAVGTVVESTLDIGRGYVTNLLVESGTLHVGDPILAGQYSGKIKAMFDERGNRVDEAGPSVPVSVLGFDGAPNAGDNFNVFEDEKEARTIAVKRQQRQREQGVRTQKSVTLEELGRRIAVGEFKELNLIVKGDVDGSIEALGDSLEKLSTEKVQVKIIHKAVGQISESDILLASASNAYIIGFQVRPSSTARKLAEEEEVQIKLYSVIYKAIEEIREAMEGLLSAKIEEKVIGSAEIRETFKISKIGTIAGCIVNEGKILRSNKVRVLREGIVVYTGLLGSLKRFKDDAKEVAKGYECGLNIDKFNDIKVGDVIEAYEEIEVKQTLES